MTLVDHVLAAVLLVIAPIASRWSTGAMDRALAADPHGARPLGYGTTIAVEWALVVVVLIGWLTLERSAETLGLVISTEPRFVITLVIAGMLSAFLIWQVRSTRGLDADGRSALRRQLAPVEVMVPHTAGERDLFLILSATAGFCEELLYRGFFIWYLAPIAGTVGAALLSSVLFGAVHAYQGPSGMFRTAGIGLVTALLYVASGSIWPAVVVHIAIDVQGGLIGYAVFTRHEALTERDGCAAV